MILLRLLLFPEKLTNDGSDTAVAFKVNNNSVVVNDPPCDVRVIEFESNL